MVIVVAEVCDACPEMRPGCSVPPVARPGRDMRVLGTETNARAVAAGYEGDIAEPR